jgi:hypothetical protein
MPDKPVILEKDYNVVFEVNGLKKLAFTFSPKPTCGDAKAR